LAIRVQIRIDRELTNAACGKTRNRPASHDRRNDSAAPDAGAATMPCWQQLPAKARPTIINQTNDAIGLTPVPDIRTEIYD
jgi:hypothetical protein